MAATNVVFGMGIGLGSAITSESLEPVDGNWEQVNGEVWGEDNGYVWGTN